MKETLNPPGPKPFLPLFNVLEFRQNPLDFLARLGEKYGDISFFKLGNQPAVFLNHPDLVKDVLVTNNAKFFKGRALQMAKMILGEGLLTSENPVHMRQRRIIQPLFNHKRISDYGNIMADFAEQYQQRWKDGETVDISAEMMGLTLEIVAKALFDSEVESEKREIHESLTVLVRMFNALTNPFLYIIRKRQFGRAKTLLDRKIMAMIEERRANPVKKDDLLSVLLNAEDEEGDQKGMTDKQIRDEALTLFLAGHETTANLLSWTWYLLALHPEVEENLHSELDSVLDNFQAKPEDVPKLTYTRKVITEVMRLYPPAWGIGRRNIEPYTVKGFDIPVNTLFLLSPYLMQRDRRFYEEPLKFNPERWNEENKKSLPKFAYFPFGGGPRICIGEQFAWMESILLLAIIAQKWKMELVPEHIVETQALITLRPKNGIKMVLRKRER
jgi:cytochrome P450